MCRANAVNLAMPLLLAMAVSGCASQKPFPYTGIESSYEMRTNKDDDADRVPFKYTTKVKWSRYDSIMLEPVVIYNGKDNQFADIDQSERQALANDMTVKFSEELGKHFRFAGGPAPRTLRIRLTLTGAETTTTGLAPFSRFDIGMGSYNLVQAARDRKGTFTGSVSYAVEIYDASSSRLLQSYVTRQYPKTYDISSTFGSLTAAHSGISRGAKSLAEALTAN